MQSQTQTNIPILACYVDHLLGVLQDGGITPTPWLERFDLDWNHLQAANARIPLTTYFALVQSVLDSTDIPGLGLRVGKHLPILDQGILGYAFYSSASLAKACSIYDRYGGLLGPTLRADLQHGTETTKVSFTPSLKLQSSDQALMRYEVELEFVSWGKLGQLFNAPHYWFSEIHFSFSEPDHSELYRQQFGCPIYYEQPENSFVFANHYLEQVFDSANEEAAHLIEQHCTSLLAELSHEGGLVGEIQRLLGRSGGRYPSMSTLCRSLNMSTSTLRRRLATQNTTYKQLVKNFRLQLAQKYLNETQLSVTEVAYLAGYTDVANFHRAFRKAFQCSPNHLRKQLQDLRA